MFHYKDKRSDLKQRLEGRSVLPVFPVRYITLILLVCLAAGIRAQSPMNGSFEDLSSGNTPSAWADFGSIAPQSLTGPSVHGSRFLLLEDTSATDSLYIRSYPIYSINQGNYYSGMCQFTVLSGQVSVGIEYYDLSNNLLGSYKSVAVPDTGWQCITVSGKAPDGSKSIRLVIHTSGPGMCIGKADIAGVGLLNNSCFEQVSSGLAVHWWQSGETSATRCVSYNNSTEYGWGNYTLRIRDNSNTNSAGVRSSNCFYIRPGQLLSLSALCYVESGRLNSAIEFYDNTDSLILTSQTVLNYTRTWERITLSSEVPPDAVYFRVHFFSTDENTGTGYIDRVYLNFLENGFFELSQNNKPSDWILIGDSSAIAASSTAAYEGTKGVSVSTNNTGVASRPLSQIMAGMPYFVTGYVHPAQGTASVCLSFYNIFGQLLADSTTEVQATGLWVPVHIEMKAPNTVCYAQVKLLTGNAGPQLTYFDRFTIDDVLDIDSVRQLFIDDYVLSSSKNITRELHPAIKDSIPVLIPDRPWEKLTTIFGTVRKDTSFFEMWYLAYTHTYLTLLCYATSQDGVNWNKPSLGIYNYNGNTVNNILMDYVGVSSIVKDTTDIPARCYKLYGYFSNTHQYESWYSPDGITNWHKMETHVHHEDVCTMARDSYRNRYVCNFKIGTGSGVDYKRDFYNAESGDLVSFTPGIKMYSLADSVDIQNVPGTLRADSYGMGIFPYEHVYIGFDWVFYINDYNPGGPQRGPGDVQLAFSRDFTRQWKRTATQPLIPRGNYGTFDDGMIFTCGYPLIINNEIIIYYGASDTEHDTTGSTSRIGRARWRLDGFVSLNSDVTPDTVVTNKLLIKGNYLLLNTDASAGYIIAEILDENGLVIPGFSAANCIPVTTDNIKTVMKWYGQDGTGILQNRIIRVRFISQNAKLYAFGFANDTLLNSIGSGSVISGTTKYLLFPNPAKNQLTISGITARARITIYTISGKQCLEKELLNSNNAVDISSLARGIYVISINEGKEETSLRFVKY